MKELLIVVNLATPVQSPEPVVVNNAQMTVVVPAQPQVICTQYG